ncbi:MAG: Asp-tRNA(Asn)/Glu-tRNA(Gln) amidotransferase subunit GatC [Rhodococcus sp.]|nr:Asp-tRNA(Asn)/Glu-tRNA(Gln) amidotransferase subunit GatC [Rhodococcus sp. (in: high G+C Gram-positive bacteria)]
MSIESRNVLDIAHLARLHLPDDDVGRIAGELSAILAFIEQMNEVDTDGVIPMAHPLDMTQRLRADAVTEPDRREELQANAPAVRDGLYLVPRVI